METAKTNFQNIDRRTEVTSCEKTFLVLGSQKIPIQAECASKYSLFFRFCEKQRMIDFNKPVNLLIQNDGNHLEVGPCRIISGTDIIGCNGRIVFERDVYDIKSLLHKKKIEKLQTFSSELHPLLERKEKVKPSFKKYIADLSYDLGVYKKLFDAMDMRYRSEPEEVQRAVQKAIIYSEGPDFRRFFEDKLLELKGLVQDFSPEEHRHHGYYFRRQLWNFIMSCPFTSRATLKPRGYAGDSELMRMIYLNDYQGDSTFSKIAHKHAVEHTAAESVRYRIHLITHMLKKRGDFSARPSLQKIKILSVGCGPAFELKQILMSPQDCERYQFTLFDQDASALSEATEVTSEIKKDLGLSPEIDYVQGSVRLMLFSRQLKRKWGQFEFIYSMGLFDYLNTRVASAVLDRLYRLLKPGGDLVVGNFHIDNPSKYYMQYWGDWYLLHRTEAELRNLFRNDSNAKVSILYDETKSQMFLHINKTGMNA